jgi:hypothetical protein
MKRLPVLFGTIILLGLLLPMVQQATRFIYVRPLTGMTDPDTSKMTYSWWNRDLQRYMERYATDSLAFQPACIRVRNQFEFSVFDKLNALDIYEHDGYFYRYTHATYSEDHAFVGYEKIARQAQLLRQFQQQLNPDSIPIYVLITSSKMHYYAEHLPERNRPHTQRTNYIQYKKALEAAGIRVLDADAWFLREKQKQPKPALMSTGGVHWTLYGGAVAFDSLIRRVNADKHTDFQRVEMSVYPKGRIYPEDMDVVGLCNLLVPPPDDPQLRLIDFPAPAYPKKRLRPVIVSDSFFNVIAWTPLHPQILDTETPFYYYFHTRFTLLGCDPKIEFEQVRKDIRQADCIVIVTDIQNMERFGFGFIEEYVEKALER